MELEEKLNKSGILEIIQTGPTTETDVILAQIVIERDTTAANTVPVSTNAGNTVVIAQNPYSIQVTQTSENVCTITHSATSTISTATLTSDLNCFYRSVGNMYWFTDDMNEYSKLRGGYHFATAQGNQSALTGYAGIADESHILSFQLSISPDNRMIRIPLLHSANTVTSMFTEQKYELKIRIREDSNQWEIPLIIFDFPAYDYLSDSTKTQADLDTHLKSEYGNPSKTPPLHARHYFPYFRTSTNRTAQTFVTMLHNATNFITSKIPSSLNMQLFPLEVACTFLTEGGWIRLESFLNSNTVPTGITFNGYDDLGIDAYISDWNSNDLYIRRFTHPDLERSIRAGGNEETQPNEANDTLTSFRTLNLQNALYAIAGLYANRKAHAVNATTNSSYVGEWRVNLADMPLHIQYWWTTAFFNTGTGNGRSFLQQYGLEYHDHNWRTSDNHTKFSEYIKYNANWRTATLRLHDAFLTL